MSREPHDSHKRQLLAVDSMPKMPRAMAYTTAQQNTYHFYQCQILRHATALIMIRHVWVSLFIEGWLTYRKPPTSNSLRWIKKYKMDILNIERLDNDEAISSALRIFWYHHFQCRAHWRKMPRHLTLQLSPKRTTSASRHAAGRIIILR